MERRLANRRQWLHRTGGGFFALASQCGVVPLLARRPSGVAKHCIVLWMGGGPSQLETFDPKPGTETGGECRDLATSISGIRISELLPRMARQTQHLAVLKCIESPEGEHIRAEYYLHTGYRNVPAFPRPPLGAMVSHHRGHDSIPHYVTLGGTGFGPAFLGADHAPFEIADAEEVRELLQNVARRSGRMRLLRELEQPFANRHSGELVQARRARMATILSMARTEFTKALDVTREPSSVRRQYGDHEFAKNCLLARRLIEAGVSFVEVRLDGWDTHADNFRQTKRLAAELDQPWARLLQDLSSRGLLDETLVVWMGEFGRTPTINARRGRDHFPRFTPVVLAGAGVPRGAVVGATNRNGTAFTGPRHSVPDLMATILEQLGISSDTEYTTSFGSPTGATDGGTPIFR